MPKQRRSTTLPRPKRPPLIALLALVLALAGLLAPPVPLHAAGTIVYVNAGAGTNDTTTFNIQRAVLLLGQYGFNGLTYSPKLSPADASTATCLATQLDNYNSGRPVNTCP